MRRVDDERALWLAANVLPHEAVLRAWLRSHRLIQADVEDVLQETYAAVAGLERVDHIRDSRTYLFSVARRLMVRCLRRKRVISIDAMAEIDISELPADEPSLEAQTDSGEELRRVVAQIDMLPAKCRRAFLLRKVDGMSQAQIAAEMGIAESTVEKHLGKALRLLMTLCGRGQSADSQPPAPTPVKRRDVRTSRKTRY
jgi:RNA polymerase sigma-70 factor (ECF subfamily)